MVLVRLRLVPSDPEKVVVQRTAAPAGEAGARIDRVRSETEVDGLIMIRARVFCRRCYRHGQMAAGGGVLAGILVFGDFFACACWMTGFEGLWKAAWFLLGAGLRVRWSPVDCHAQVA